MVEEVPGHNKDRKDSPGLPHDPEAGGPKDPESYLRQNPQLEEDLKSLFNKLNRIPGSKPTSPEIVKQALADDNIPPVLGDFKVIREIGCGGMATVYEAVQISLKHRVALKVLPFYLNYSSKAVSKFQIEAEAGSRQLHPGIVLIYARGKHGKIHYIAEEFIEGGKTVAHWLKVLTLQRNFPRKHFLNIAELFVKVADALHHAHQSGVIHRDVKPSNILLTPDFEPKVTDFGLAVVEGMKHLSSTNNLSGTLYYMSPEQARGRRGPLDYRTDIYSLGVTLYECLTLEHPFQAAKRVSVLHKILTREPSDPVRLDSRVPRDLATICLKAMEKEPHRRYQSMADFSDDLHRYLKGEVIQAKPAGPAQRFLRLVKRNPVLSTVSSLAILVLLALLSYVLWSYPVILSERNKAHLAQQAVAKEATKAKALNQFLGDMFASPIPGAKGRDVKVADMLDLASEKASLTLTDQPEIEARFRYTLGRSYYGIGFYEKANEQYQEALLLADMVFHEEHPDRMALFSHLATTQWALGEFETAEAMHRKAISLQEKVLGKEHPDTLRSKTNLATTLNDQGALAEAADLLLEVVEIRRRTQGEDDIDTAHTLNNLAISLMDRGSYESAEKILRRISRTYRNTLGEEHPDRIGALVNLTFALTEQEKFDEAEPIARTCLALSRQVLGKDHPNSFVAECTLANLLMAQDKLPEAEEAFRNVMVRMRRVLGSRHPHSLVPAINLGAILAQQGKDQEAEEHLRETLALAEEALPEKSMNLVTVRMYLGELLVKTGQYEEAEEHILRSLAVFEEILGKDNHDTLSIVRAAIQLYENWGKPEKAARFRARLPAPRDLD